MTEVAHTYSIEEKITVAIKNTVDFGWIQSSSCLLHHQEIVDGIAQSVTRISVPWWCKQRNRSLMEASRQKATRRKMKILSHGCKVMPPPCITNFFRMHGCSCQYNFWVSQVICPYTVLSWLVEACVRKI